MNYKPYNKHQLHRGKHPADSDGKIKLPDDFKWRVARYIGKNNWWDGATDFEITLLLEKTYRDGRGLWSVMSFLTTDEAQKLAQALLKAVEEKS
jgi:hypothetical protein